MSYVRCFRVLLIEAWRVLCEQLKAKRFQYEVARTRNFRLKILYSSSFPLCILTLFNQGRTSLFQRLYSLLQNYPSCYFKSTAIKIPAKTHFGNFRRVIIPRFRTFSVSMSCDRIIQVTFLKLKCQ